MGAVTTLNALVGIAAAIALLLLGNSLLAWWTRGAIAAPQAMILLNAAALVAGAVWEPISVFLLAVNRHERFTYAFAVAACLVITLSYLFVRQWGVTGAAAANLLLDIAMLGFASMYLRRLTGPFPVGLSALWVLAPQRWRRAIRRRLPRRSAERRSESYRTSAHRYWCGLRVFGRRRRGWGRRR
jgi:Na+-driven multidrug efflux pump